MSPEDTSHDEFNPVEAAYREMSNYDQAGMMPGERREIVDEALTERLPDAEERARNYLPGKKTTAVALFAIGSAVGTAMAIRGYIRKEK